jgi:SAM-dependent methyltransferase
MNLTSVAAQRQAIIERFGEWTDHNIHLVDDLYTIDSQACSLRLRRIVQVVADLADRPLQDLRIVDLACLEGQFAIEFARQGAQAVGIEGREASVRKVEFVKNVLGLDNLEVYQDDIRNLNPEKYGLFDVVLCLGVYYHLNAPDLFEMMEKMYESTTRLLVIDSYVSVFDRQRFEYKGNRYWGVSVSEHAPTATDQAKHADLWASLDNNQSIWLTRASLLNLLAHVGFTSVYEVFVPNDKGKLRDRITLAAIKGRRQAIRSIPRLDALAEADRPEKEPSAINPRQTKKYDTVKRLTNLVPKWMRRSAKWLLRSVGLLKKSPFPTEWDIPWKSRKA